MKRKLILGNNIRKIQSTYDPVFFFIKWNSYFVSASLDRTCAIWDMRKFQYQTDADDYTICERAHITSIPHRLSVNSASFSPSGNEMVTVSQDHLVSIFDASDVHHDSMKPMKNKFAIPHRNDTGKWVSKFTASWDPKDLNGRFIIGSKRQPRSTEVYHCFLQNNQTSCLGIFCA